MTQSNTAMAHSNNAMTQSNNVESKKPQHPQQQALLEQLHNVSGGWFSFYNDPWKGTGMP